MEFIKLNEDLPPANKLVWIKRKNGNIYLGNRENQPISNNPDPSHDCFWHANPSHFMLMTNTFELKFKHSFSDITVDSWADLIIP